MSRKDRITSLAERRPWTVGRCIALYTVLFAALSLYVFSWFYLSGRTFVFDGDGWTQHYRALIYYGQYLRLALRSVVSEHALTLPEWDFTLGEGNDILATLHYYAIGDPFNLGAVLVPSSYMYLYYDAMVILRLYAAGVAFILLCWETDRRSKLGVIAGAVTYVFCSWGLLNANRHPFFLDPMITMPLLLCGAERVLREKRTAALALAVMLAGVSQFYFLYMQALLMMVYVAVRLLTLSGASTRERLRKLLKLALGAVTGAAMASVILMPMCYVFLHDARMGAKQAKHLFYPLYYYSGLPSTVISSRSVYWQNIGVAVPALLGMFLLIRKRRERPALWLLLLLDAVFSLFPIFGQALNGFTYMANRWSWGTCLLLAFLLTDAWPELMEAERKELRYLAFCLGGYCALCAILRYSRDAQAFAVLGIGFLFLLALLLLPSDLESKKILLALTPTPGTVAGRGIVLARLSRQTAAFLLVIVNIALNAFWYYAPEGGDYVAEGLTVSDIEMNLTHDESAAVQEAAEQDGVRDLYRYAGRGLNKNVNILPILEKQSSTSFYWSISNPGIAELRAALDLCDTNPYCYNGYDDRTAMTALSSVKYFTAPANHGDYRPYGFSSVYFPCPTEEDPEAVTTNYNIFADTLEEARERLRTELGVETLSDSQDWPLRRAARRDYRVFRNEYCLPMTFGYTDSMSRAAWDELSSVDKQEAMLQTVVLEGKADLRSAPVLDSLERSYTVECQDSGVTLEENGFVVTSEDAQVVFSFEGIENSETYFELRGLRFQYVTPYELYHGDDSVDPLRLYNQTDWDLLSEGRRDSLRRNERYRVEPNWVAPKLQASSGYDAVFSHYMPDATVFTGQTDYCVNLGYAEDPVTSITFTFPEIGVYSFDEIRIICQPMDRYAEQVAALGEHTLEDFTVETDAVSGHIQLSEPIWLCFFIPYSPGWKAYVDGQEAELLRANVKNMAVYLEPGEHSVRLAYHTPLLKLGAAVTTLSCAVFVCYVVLSRRKERERQENAVTDCTVL